MMAMLQCCLLVFLLVGCQIHTAESAVTFPADPVVSITKKPAVNLAVVNVTATDTAGSTLAYTLKSQTPDSTPKVFSINGTSGAITVSNVTQLEYPTKKQYTLVIEAAQSANGNSTETGTTTVTVNLVNKEPTFALAWYTACINKGSPAGTIVEQVTASDEDGDTLAYSITAGDGNSIFDVESASGTIKVDDKKTIGETPASYNLTITATDNDETSASGTAKVIISVDDPCPGVPPAGSFATTITASFCLFLLSGAVHLLRIW